MAPPAVLPLYLTLVTVAGVAGLAVTASQYDWSSVATSSLRWSLLFLVLASVIGELKPLAVPRGDRPTEGVSTSTPFILALVAVGGVGVALLTQVVASLTDDLRSRRGPQKTLFNAGQYTVSVLAGRAAYSLVAGVPFFAGPGPIDLPRLGALLVAGLVMVLVNRLLVGVVVALASAQRLAAVVMFEVPFFVTTQTVMLSLGGVAAEMASRGPGFLALLAAPAVAVYLATAAGLRHAHQAFHDPLTGLGNRERLRSHLAAALNRPEDGDVGLVLLDLDHFKDINDALGHEVGDHLLREVAGRLVDVTQGRARAHRLGGDEFAVIVPGDLVAAETIAYQALGALEEPFRIGELELRIRASAGVAVGPDHAAEADALLKIADIALYHAKLERDRVSTYQAEYEHRALDRFRLLTDLRTASDRGELYVLFQPQLDLHRRRTVAVEALVRWQHPTRGPISPDTFVPLAEDAGLINPLTTYVLDESLRALAGWRRAGHEVRVSVNLSARHLSDLALPRHVNEALERYEVPASALVLEVTETALLADPVRADVVISALRALGVGVAVDDYGTGHASLTYLKRLEVDELKVDRSFVSDLNEDRNNFIIVRSTIALARDLGLRVVAEGIEDEMTARTLHELGCALGQGFHFGRPETADDVTRRLAAEPTEVPQPAGSTEDAPCC